MTINVNYIIISFIILVVFYFSFGSFIALTTSLAVFVVSFFINERDKGWFKNIQDKDERRMK